MTAPTHGDLAHSSLMMTDDAEFDHLSEREIGPSWFVALIRTHL
jgi:hypothetical protein